MINKTAHRPKRAGFALDKKLLTKKAKLVIILLSGAAILLVLVQIYFSGKVAVTGERIKALELEKKQLVLENDKLQDKINQLSSLILIEEKARTNLQMVDGVDAVWYLPASAALARR